MGLSWGKPPRACLISHKATIQLLSIHWHGPHVASIQSKGTAVERQNTLNALLVKQRETDGLNKLTMMDIDGLVRGR